MQYDLVLVSGGRCSTAGKVSMGLASHWPCVTDFRGPTTYGLAAHERETISGAWRPLPFVVCYDAGLRLHCVVQTSSFYVC